MFSIVYPQLLLLLFPLLILLWISRDSVKLNNFSFHEMAIVDKRESINIKLIILSAVLIIIALSRPIIKEQKEETKILSSNVIFALDLSYSMRGNDINPSRLNVAKDIIYKVSLLNTTDKFALFGFTTNVLPLSPLSLDHTIIRNSLDVLNDEYILTKGTSIINLLDDLDSLNYNNPLVFIFSDGGDENINLTSSNIYPVQMATKKGAKLPIENQFVISQLNPTFSNENNIMYSGVDSTVEKILDVIKNTTKTTMVNSSTTNNHELFIYFVLLATVLFIMGVLDLKPKILLLLSILGIHLHAGLLDFYHIQNKNYCAIKNFEGQYNCGVSLYKEGYYTKSLAIFKSLKSNEIKIKSDIFYNIGNCEYMIKDYKRAIISYQKSLELQYNDNAKYNMVEALFQQSSIPQMAKDKNNQQKKKTFEKSKEDRNSKSSSGLNLKLTTKEENKNVLGSKSYNMINKGYINEIQPW